MSPRSLPSFCQRPALWPGLALALALASSSAMAQPGGACRVKSESAAQPPTVVELYTSEGCSSCPPADRWLSELPSDARTLPLGFHVNYWDHLGWQDKLATAETTSRQRKWREALKAQHVYTPQFIVNGADFRAWPQRAADLPKLAAAPAPQLRLSREAGAVQVEVGANTQAERLAGYWVVLQDGIRHDVLRGENVGRSLLHHHVVRLYQPVAPWPSAQPQRLSLDLAAQPALAQARVAFVVTTADGLRPLQALSLSCQG